MTARNARPAGMLSAGSAMSFVVLISTVSFFSDMNYEGGRSLTGQFLELLGSSAAAVGIAVGAGEFIGYGLRFISGYWADRSGAYWPIALLGYFIQLFAMPLLAFVGSWQVAVGVLVVERLGKGIRNPARDAMLSYATKEMGRGWGYGLHAAMDQAGGFVGPLVMFVVLSVKATGDTDDLASYQTAFAFLFLPAIVAMCLLLAARARFPNPRDLESKTPIARTEGLGRTFWLYCLAGGLIGAGFADFALMAFHFKTIELIDDRWIPVLFAFGIAIDAAVALVAGRGYDRRPLATLLLTFGLGGVFAPFVFLGESVPLVIVGLGLWGVGIAGQEAVMKAALADTLPVTRRGYGFGTFSLIFGLCWFLGSALMGVLYEIDVKLLVVFSTAISLLALPIFWSVRSRRATNTEVVD
jgi:MFS family permease